MMYKEKKNRKKRLVTFCWVDQYRDLLLNVQRSLRLMSNLKKLSGAVIPFKSNCALSEVIRERKLRHVPRKCLTYTAP